MSSERSRLFSQEKFTLGNVCRLCLFSDFPMSNIYRTNIVSGDEIYKVLNYLFGLEISDNDQLPPVICQPCLCKITAFFAFKKNALFSKSQLIEIVKEDRIGAPGEETEYVALDIRETIIQEKQSTNDFGELNDSENNDDGESESIRLTKNVESEIQDEGFHFNAAEAKLAMKEEIEIADLNTPRDQTTELDSIHENEFESVDGLRFLSAENDQTTEVSAAEGNDEVEELFETQNEDVNKPMGDIKECGSHGRNEFPSRSQRENLENNQKTPSAPLPMSCSSVGLRKLRSSQKRKREQDEEEVDSNTESVNKEGNQYRRVNIRSSKTDTRKEPTEMEHVAKEKVMVDIEEETENGINRAEGEYVKCHHCGETRVTLDELKKHIYTVHLSLFVAEDIEGILCQKTFKYDSFLPKHLVKHTGSKPIRLDYSAGQVSHLNRHLFTQTDKKLFQCNLCEYRCSKRAALKVHLLRHTGEKPFKCDMCQYRCSTKSILKVHLHTHTGERPFKCDLCDYGASRLSLLKLHFRKHTGEKPYACDLCEYRCSNNSALGRHMRRHTGEKPFKCNLCDYKSTANASLQVHLRTHTGEKPFKCDMCEYRSTNGSHLRVHLRSHTGEKPFKCNLCEYRCTSSSTLKQHLQRHTGEKPFKCKLCNYSASRISKIKLHLRTHTGEKPYECGLCEFRCAHSSSLKRHMGTHRSKKVFKCDICDYRSSFLFALKGHKLKHGYSTESVCKI